MRRMVRAELSDEEFSHYQAVVPTVASRAGIAEFPKQILAARPWLATIEKRVRETLTEKPLLLVWGMRDPAFGRGPFLKKWQAEFPEATLLRLEDAGHYIQEDAPDEIVRAIRDKFSSP